MSRRTVNGIKVKDIDEKTRSIILRAGDIESQVLKAAELNVLDEGYYSKFIQGLRKANKIRSLLLLICLYSTYGFCLVNIGKMAIYILV